MNNIQAASWVRVHRKKLVLACMFSGGVYHSTKLFNCRLFGLSMLDMGLSHRQLLFISQKTIIINALVENLPQIIIQIIYLSLENSIVDIVVILALASSAISFVSALISSLMNLLDDLSGMLQQCCGIIKYQIVGPICSRTIFIQSVGVRCQHYYI